MSARADRRQLQAKPLAAGDFIELATVPFSFGPAMPYRRARCVACGDVIGGRQARVLVCVPAFGQPCVCGAIDSAAVLLCPDHPSLRDGQITHLVEQLAARTHAAGHQCH